MSTVVPRWTGLQARALRLALRMSVRQWAAHLGVNTAAVSGWERRGAAARLRYETQQLLDIELGRAPGEVRDRFDTLLGELVRTATGDTPQSQAPSPAGAEAYGGGPAEPVAAADRTDPTGLAELGWLDGFAAGDEPVTVAVVLGGQELRFTLSRRAFVGVVSGVLSGFVDGPAATSPLNVDPDVVGYFAALRALLVDADNRLGAASVLPTVRVQIGLIDQYRRQTTGGLRDRLLATQARWVEFAGWLSDDLGHRTAGAGCLDQAVSMAQEAADPEFGAYLLARQAQRAVGGHDEERVVALAGAALRVTQAPPLVSAFAAVQQAQGRAIEGDRAGFQQAMAHATELVEAHPAVDGELGAFCTGGYIAAHEGEGLLRLGKPRAAVSCFTTAMAAWPTTYQRERGLCLARAAAAHLAGGDPDQAATVALKALVIAASTGSARIRDHVATVGAQATEYADRPAVQALRDALADTR